MLLGVVDLLMVGRVSVEAFDAVALGNFWKVGTLFPAMGLVFGIAPLVSRQEERLGNQRVAADGGVRSPEPVPRERPAAPS